MKKVVITGLGAVTALGNNVADYWNSLIEGKSGMRTITRVSAENHDTTVAAEVDDSFEEVVSKYWKKRMLSATTKAVRIGLVSAEEAIEDSGADFASLDRSRIGIICGLADNTYEGAEKENKSNITLKSMPSELPAMIAIKHNITGPSFNMSTACASSGYALALGKHLIQSGLCDMIIVGGLSYVMNDAVLYGFNQLLAMSANPDPNKACRPFTKNRDGFIMGEGGGTMILESEEHAISRKAKVYCELAGASISCEANSLTAPQADGVGMSYSMRCALEDAGIAPEKVDYINAHGTSTTLNDLYETLAIKQVFGDKAYDIPVSSIKAAIGHTLSACGVLEGIACVKAIETGVLPPTVHFDEPDPQLDLNYIPNTAQKKDINVAVSNSFGFGGHDATLVFRKYN
ncbi:beta-ketoacyl-[acyl-carrier-protein] synthase family protein [Ruminococcus albus]|uniref:beta-ketoacyl-[acyl-carrier-protein] synthase family protein n=1 Tax=Ruminococcus albus TaxID=1264 RepID=UPI0004663D3C|nr:beta-ketoacyl-[acyl-carrier-protein] synthase family protein [Ruminococcus albus]